MKCPECRSPKGRVLDSRPSEIGIRRRRVCDKCDNRWSTYEVDEVALEKMKRVSMRSEFMEIAQSELNKAYFRMMEQLKKRALIETEEDASPVECEVVPFHLKPHQKRA